MRDLNRDNNPDYEPAEALSRRVKIAAVVAEVGTLALASSEILDGNVHLGASVIVIGSLAIGVVANLFYKPIMEKTQIAVLDEKTRLAAERAEIERSRS